MAKRYHEKHKNDADFLTWWPFAFIGQAMTGWKMTFAAIEKANLLSGKNHRAFENLSGSHL